MKLNIVYGRSGTGKSEYVYKDIAGGSYYKAVDDYIKILDGFYRMNDGNYKVDKEGRVVKSIPWIEIVVLSVALTFIIVVILFLCIKAIL